MVAEDLTHTAGRSVEKSRCKRVLLHVNVPAGGDEWFCGVSKFIARRPVDSRACIWNGWLIYRGIMRVCRTLTPGILTMWRTDGGGQRVRRTVTDDPQHGTRDAKDAYLHAWCIHVASARAFSHREIVIPAAVRRPRQTYINWMRRD